MVDLHPLRSSGVSQFHSARKVSEKKQADLKWIPGTADLQPSLSQAKIWFIIQSGQVPIIPKPEFRGFWRGFPC